MLNLDIFIMIRFICAVLLIPSSSGSSQELIHDMESKMIRNTKVIDQAGLREDLVVSILIKNKKLDPYQSH